VINENIVFDPKTGLPKLDDDHVFVVMRSIPPHGYFEIDLKRPVSWYSVSIQELEAQRVTEGKPIYREGWFGRKILVGYEDGELIPREPTGYIRVEYLIVELLNEPFETYTVSDEVRDAYAHMRAQYKETGSKIQLCRYSELSDESIKQAAIRCFLYWEERRKREKARDLEVAAQRTLEDKYCGAYPPKGIKNE
jgi:hypothetical protein